MTLLGDFRLHRLKHPESTNSSHLSHLCRRGSVFTTGTLGPDEARKVPARNKLQGKWHLITLQEASDYVEHEILHERSHVIHSCGLCGSLQTRTPSTLTSASNRSSFTTEKRCCQGEHGWVLQGVLTRSCLVMISQSIDVARKLQVISMAQPGVVAAATILVQLMKPLLVVPCLRRRSPLLCGDPDPSRTTGLTSVVFLSPLALSASGM